MTRSLPHPLLGGVLLAAAIVTACGAPAGAPASAPAATATAPTAAAPTDSPTVAVPQRVELRFAGGAVAGGVQRISVVLGTPVELVVASDVADEVHLHGYDRSADVAAGGTARITFTADLPGVFEVELEKLGAGLARLEVS